MHVPTGGIDVAELKPQSFAQAKSQALPGEQESAEHPQRADDFFSSTVRTWDRQIRAPNPASERTRGKAQRAAELDLSGVANDLPTIDRIIELWQAT